MKKIKLQILKMDCASCAVNIEEFLKNKKGINKVSVSYALSKAIISFDEKVINQEKIEDAIRKIGYDVGDENKALEARSRDKRKVIGSVVLGMILFYISMIKMLGYWPQLTLTTIILAINGNILLNGLKQIWQLKPGMDSLVAIGVLTAYFYSLLTGNMESLYFESAGFIVVFVGLGKYLETVTKGKSYEAVKKLISMEAKRATIIREGEEIEIEASKVKKGDVVVVKPGENIPVDGVIIWGKSYVDEKMITGESVPVLRMKGDEVIGGTINIDGNIRFKASQVGKDMMLSKIIKTVEEAMESKAPIQALADKISLFFVPLVVGLSIVSFLIWWGLSGDLSMAIRVLVSVLIIACPCALGLATPTAIMAGMGLAAKNGILIKNGEVLQKTEKINTVAFDKTGTLTKGEMKVMSIKGDKDVLKITASVEKMSEHPIAKAIVKEAMQKKIKLMKVADFKNEAGMGVEAKINGNKIIIGTGKFLKDKGIDMGLNEYTIKEWQDSGKTVVMVAKNGKMMGMIAVADEIRKEAKEAINKIVKSGKKTVMITGDNKQVAINIAKEIGIERVVWEVLPTEKAEEIVKLKNEGLTVAMVGDGVNDAPALAKSDLGIVMGGGTDVAIETGEIVLLRNDLNDVIKAISLSRFTMKKIKQNLFWAFFYNVISIPVAAGLFYPVTGWLLNPSVAAGAMAFSSVSVVLNSLSMKMWKLNTGSTKQID